MLEVGRIKTINSLASLDTIKANTQLPHANVQTNNYEGMDTKHKHKSC